MTRIILDQTDFVGAQALAELIRRRGIAVQLVQGWPSEPAEKSPIIVMSAAAEAGLGGSQKMLERARGLRPMRVVVIDEAAEAFTIREELEGKLQRLALRENEAQGAYGQAIAAEILCFGLSSMIAADPASMQLTAVASRVAQADVTVLINGPTGTGKEVMARFIHARSPRADKPFVAINCAAIPENMLEAMMFGHEKGAFTGASVANKGLFRAADGGTLLLDEISEMPIGLQSKLLRVLQERCVTPLGVQKEVAVDVRVIATTNRDMAEEVRRNSFREDLFYRLNVFPLETLPLRDRPQDILPLAVGLLRRHAEAGASIPWMTQEAVDVLERHDWPGNVRELENVIQRGLVLHANGCITPADIILDTGRSLQMRPDWLARHTLSASGKEKVA
ncbi:sigma-54 interaction domain-containing protein [Roseicyclus sp.]|uniref:sigma-54 interaction domain-containing protein n=1 Tax=Roseicyclus sp. TaxID=1914329 RepID=UPI003F6B3AA6